MSTWYFSAILLAAHEAYFIFSFLFLDFGILAKLDAACSKIEFIFIYVGNTPWKINRNKI